MSTTDQSTVSNRILRALPAKEFARIAPHLERIELLHGHPLYSSGDVIDFVYFVESGFVSIVGALDKVAPLELGIIGTEGAAGYVVVLGAKTTFGDAMSQMSGDALRISAPTLLLAIDNSPVLKSQLLHFAHAMHIQVAQTAACNSRHEMTERLARWLLGAHDRRGADALPLTTEFLSMMLGVRASTVSVAQGMLSSAGLIDYKEGITTVLDRPGLERAACECYKAVADEYGRIFA